MKKKFNKDEILTMSNELSFLRLLLIPLTQAALVISLLSRYPWMWALLILFIIKESLMILWGYLTPRCTNTVNSAKWYGKLSTVILYAGIH